MPSSASELGDLGPASERPREDDDRGGNVTVVQPATVVAVVTVVVTVVATAAAAAAVTADRPNRFGNLRQRPDRLPPGRIRRT
jgi:hypothetical protein